MLPDQYSSASWVYVKPQDQAFVQVLALLCNNNLNYHRPARRTQSQHVEG